MTELDMNIKITIDEEKKEEYFSDLAEQVLSGEISEGEAIALIQVDYKQFTEIEVVKNG